MKAGTRFIISSILTALLFISAVSGQTEQMIIPGDLKQQTIITEPVTLRKGYLRTGVEGAFILIDRTFDEEGKRDYILGTNAWGKGLNFQLPVHYGITDRLEAGVKIPYVNQQYFISTVLTDVISGTDSIISYRSKGRGLGDVEVGFRYQLMVETDNHPSLLLGVVATVPTGEKNPTNVVDDLQYDLPTGEGYFALETFLAVRKMFYPYAIQFRVDYEYYFPGSKIFSPDEPEIEFKNGNMLLASARFDLHLNDWIALSNEIGLQYFTGNTYHYDPVETSPSSISVDYIPSLYFQIRRFRFLQGIFVPLYGKYLSADPAYAFGLSYIF